jgi:hypothetical protein
MHIERFTVPGWEQFPDLVHVFLGRTGGGSARPYASLNLSYRVGDERQQVKDNWCVVKKALGVHERKVTLLRQIHGDNVLTVSRGDQKEAGEGDAMITKHPNVFLGILTADCVPIFLVEPQQKVVAAIHAGWRGTVRGIIAKTITRLQEEFGVTASTLYAALGPAIERCCYEVGEEVYTQITAQWDGLAKEAWCCVEGRYYLDLRTLHVALLVQQGIPAARIARVGPCTGCNTNRFFSYRREQGNTGRQASVIGWRDYA